MAVPPLMNIVTRIEVHMDQAQQCWQQADMSGAFTALRKAIVLLPEAQPVLALGVLGRYGDYLFKNRQFADALDVFRQCEMLLSGKQNLFIQLRLAQCLVERGQLNDALPLLKALWKQEGDNLFREDDPKYRSLAKTGRLPKGRSYPTDLLEQRRNGDNAFLLPSLPDSQ